MILQCAILDDYQNVALTMANWQSLAGSVAITAFNTHIESEEQLVKRLCPYDIVVIMRERTPFTASLFSRLPNLKLLITSGMRNASIDLTAAAQHNIIVSGTQSFSEPPVELTWALILGLARHIVPEHLAFKSNGPWQQTLGVDLFQKRLGIIGLGKIGRQVARIGLAFGMEVMAWSQNLTREAAEAEGVLWAASKKELMESCDFITVHLVLSERTMHLITAEDFHQMRKTAYFINTSRAQIVDHQALLEALQHQRIAGAGLDVFPTEPLPEKDLLRSLPNVLATPHLGYVTQKNYQVYFDEALENIHAYLAGKPIRLLEEARSA